MISREEALKTLFQPGSSQTQSQERVALVQAVGKEERSVTFAQLELLVAQLRARLQTLAIRPADRVVLSSENSPELVAALLACWSMGVCAVPVDVRLTGPEVGNVFTQLHASALLSSSRLVSDLEKTFKPIVGQKPLVDLAALNSQSGSGEAVELDSINLDLPAFVILTSGTTGTPKGAVHTLGTLVTNLIELGQMAGINEEMSGVLPLPLSHIFGLEVCMASLLYRTKTIFSEFGATSFVECLDRHKPQLVSGVPTLYAGLLAAPNGAIDLSNAKVLLSGGAPMPEALAGEFEEKFGKRLNNGYGSTESKIVALNMTGPVDSVGKIVPSVKIEIVDESDQVLPEGQTGEIRIAGPILMSGYADQQEMTEKVLHDGHYHTGDMGYFKDGNLFIAGRSKELIIVGGYKVFPLEVEDALMKFPEVQEAAVFGQPHRQLGQLVKAVLVVKDGERSKKLEGNGEAAKEAHHQLTAELKEYCKENLRRELRPMEWEFHPASKPLPKTLAGKIDKKKLAKPEPAPAK